MNFFSDPPVPILRVSKGSFLRLYSEKPGLRSVSPASLFGSASEIANTEESRVTIERKTSGDQSNYSEIKIKNYFSFLKKNF